jgi:hypothetical protein
VIILDHNITEDQVDQLRRWKIHLEQIGVEVGRPEWDDQQEILRYLHRARSATFFTRDDDFFSVRLCHATYCLVFIDAANRETASFIRRFLRHPAFKTKAKRCGKVVKLSPRQVAWYEKGRADRQYLIW